jgi:PAS domain S-box-containing protein
VSAWPDGTPHAPRMPWGDGGRSWAVDSPPEQVVAIFQAILGTAPVGIGVVDTQLRFVVVNDHLAAMHDTSVDGHLGRRPGEVSSDLGTQVEPLFQRVLDDEEPLVDVELDRSTSSGDARVWRASYFPVRLDGAVIGVGTIVVDVSEARHALAQEQTARAAAEVAGDRAQRLHGLAGHLAGAVTPAEVGAVAVHRFAAAEADRATLVRHAADGLVPVDEHNVDPSYRSWIRTVDLRRSTWAAPVLDGKPVWVPDRQAFEADHPGSQMAASDPVSAAWCLLPLVSPRGIVGVLALHWDEPQPFDDAQRAFLRVASELIGSALARAATHEELQRAHDRLRAAYDQRDRVARTLRAGLAPRALHLSPPLESEAVLRLGSADQVGGDFYDGVRTGDGSWLVAVGDVCGKGAEAAALTALVRYTVRAAAMSTADHESILRTVNRALLDEDTGLFCALTLLGFIPQAGRTDLVVTLAGQHEARLCRPGCGVELVGTFGSLLGVSHDLTLQPARAVLEAGAVVVAFTDGLVERSRTFDEEQVDRELAELARRSTGLRPGQLVDDVVRAGFARPADHSDDICVLAVGHRAAG